MEKIEQLIAAALSEEERELLKGMPDPTIFTLGFGLFRGPNGWYGYVIFAVVLAMFFGSLWCGWYFYAATEPVAALKWGLSAAVLMVVATQVKMALMPQMQAERILQALRRVELMVLKQRA